MWEQRSFNAAKSESFDLHLYHELSLTHSSYIIEHLILDLFSSPLSSRSLLSLENACLPTLFLSINLLPWAGVVHIPTAITWWNFPAVLLWTSQTMDLLYCIGQVASRARTYAFQSWNPFSATLSGQTTDNTSWMEHSWMKGWRFVLHLDTWRHPRGNVIRPRSNFHGPSESVLHIDKVLMSQWLLFSM